jgi:NAD+ diphosphatase
MNTPGLLITDAEPETVPQNAVFLIYHGDRLLTDMRGASPVPLEGSVLGSLETDADVSLFLGYWQDRACYALAYVDSPQFDPMQFNMGSLYQLLGRVHPELFALAGRGLQIVSWHFDHQFCGRCGAPMQRHPKDRAMSCKPCRQLLYPRLSPAIIVLVTRGNEMLLARNHSFPEGMYSTLAGFVEAGESSEQCVRREVEEETGIIVKDIQYFGSQPWPFPSQLMLGFFAEYDSGVITPDDDEIADAQWFTASNMPATPPAHAISGQLIENFLRRQTEQD